MTYVRNGLALAVMLAAAVLSKTMHKSLNPLVSKAGIFNNTAKQQCFQHATIFANTSSFSNNGC